MAEQADSTAPAGAQDSVPVYAAGSQPQYEYDPHSGYIIPGQFDDADGPLAEARGSGAGQPAYTMPAPPQPPQFAANGKSHEGGYYYGDDDDEGDEDLFDDALNDQDWSSATGDFTKSYNRQRRLVEVAQGAPGSCAAPPPRVNPQRPKANVAARVDDQIASLAKFTARIKLDDITSSIDGKSERTHDKSDRATSEQVLDPRTRMILLQLINRSILHSINGVLSTGKEANVYHALSDPPADDPTQTPLHRAVKVYKTSILVFKDRDRYVSGEFRFRHGYNKSNNWSMVKVWAEKEMRNLKRIYAAGIPCPEPIYLRLHVLVMGFIGDRKGWPAPRLRDAGIEDPETFDRLYIDLLTYMRIMYHVCRLVHADLSEYNLLYHKSKLWIIDVSQSVEHDHPRSLEFLRMDIKNVTDFFKRKGVDTFSERTLFEFIISSDFPMDEGGVRGKLAEMERDAEKEADEAEKAEAEIDENVFRQAYIPRTLEQVYDVERDVAKVRMGEGQNLIYKDLLADTITVTKAPATKSPTTTAVEAKATPKAPSILIITTTTTTAKPTDLSPTSPDGGVPLAPSSVPEDLSAPSPDKPMDAVADVGSDYDDSGSDYDDSFSAVDEYGNPLPLPPRDSKAPRGKKHVAKDDKKAHKQKVKEEKREARKTKLPKHVKKKLVSQGAKKK
ncbi:RIO1 family-domain-containing protein [Kalaharituber pfeilii]|nr:RIO1 family-domain-containing protein [Kalaharituber pfeilii]